MAGKTKNLLIRQLDITDCGAACLASVFAYYGYFKPLSVLRFEAGTGKDGTSLLGMSDTAVKNGFDPLPVKVVDKFLNPGDIPAIAHLNVNGKWFHFVVVYEIRQHDYIIMDPAIGRMKKISKTEFEKNWTGILLLLKPGGEFKKLNQVKSVHSRIFDIIRQHKRSLFKAFSGAVIFSLLGISTAFYIELLTDRIIPDGSVTSLHNYSIFLGLIIILRVMTGYLKSILLIKTGQQIDSDLINNYNQHLLSLPVIFFQSMKTGEILTRINDAIKIRNFINSTVQEIMVNSLIVVITLSMMVYYSPWLSSILIASIPFYLLIFRFLNTSNRKYLRKTMEFGAEMESQLVETIKGVNTIKAFTNERLFNQKLRKTCRNLLYSIFRTSRDFTISSHMSDLVSALWLLMILWAGAREVMLGRMTYGELFSFYSLYAYLSSPLIRLILSNRGIQDAKIATERLFQVMDLAEEEMHLKIQDIKSPHKISIEAKNLSFRYPGKKELLRGISFICEPGTITAIAGESGSGKSTLLSILLKFYSPESGSILINGTALDKIAPSLLRQKISYVPQSVELFSGSLGYNISFESGTWDEGRMHRCMELSGLNSIIKTLTMGLDTHISEDGNNFSGGEKQKIALARALYKEAGLIFLDEPSSSMDIQSEIHLIKLLDLLKNEGKTILLVAHKLTLIRSADQILVLKNGSIVEKGRHETLLESKGIYHHLWKSQCHDLSCA